VWSPTFRQRPICVSAFLTGALEICINPLYGRSVIDEGLIELGDVRAQLLHLPLLRVVGTVCRRYQQAQDQGGDGGNQPHHQLHRVSGFGTLMMFREPAAGGKACERTSEHEDEYDERYEQGSIGRVFIGGS
jgi:hypothetical protein